MYDGDHKDKKEQKEAQLDPIQSRLHQKEMKKRKEIMKKVMQFPEKNV